VLNSLIKQVSDNLLRKNIEGILYMFSDRQQTDAKDISVALTNKHIMISYNWDDQPIVKRLATALKEYGYEVWLDLEQMGGSTLEAMAGAVENADLMLICMSQKYKDSPNCRLEGEYCISRKVPYIPLIMQNGYSPDGWLGIIMGKRLYHNFHDESNWENKVENIVREIGKRGRKDIANSIRVNGKLPSSAPSVVLAWKDSDIKSWMVKEGIEKHYATFAKHLIDGKALLELKTLLFRDNTLFFPLFDRLNISEIGEMLRISAAIKNLH